MAVRPQYPFDPGVVDGIGTLLMNDPTPGPWPASFHKAVAALLSLCSIIKVARERSAEVSARCAS